MSECWPPARSDFQANFWSSRLARKTPVQRQCLRFAGPRDLQRPLLGSWELHFLSSVGCFLQLLGRSRRVCLPLVCNRGNRQRCLHIFRSHGGLFPRKHVAVVGSRGARPTKSVSTWLAELCDSLSVRSWASSTPAVMSRWICQRVVLWWWLPRSIVTEIEGLKMAGCKAAATFVYSVASSLRRLFLRCSEAI